MIHRPPRSTLFPYTNALPILLQVNSDFGPGEFEALDAAAKLAGRPLSVLLVQVDAQPKLWRERSEEHTSELQSHVNLVCRLLLEKKKRNWSIKFRILSIKLLG